MTNGKRIVNDWKFEAEVRVISQVKDYEIEMTNIVCNDQLKDTTYQQEMSNASMTLMEEAQYEVRKDDGRYMVNEITEGSEVTEETSDVGDESHGIANRCSDDVLTGVGTWIEEPRRQG